MQEWEDFEWKSKFGRLALERRKAMKLSRAQLSAEITKNGSYLSPDQIRAIEVDLSREPRWWEVREIARALEIKRDDYLRALGL